MWLEWYKSTRLSQTVVCTCFALLAILGIFDYKNFALIIVLNFIGTSFIEYTWDANQLCAVELMPTQIPASTVSSCSMIARMGAFFSPMLVHLNQFWGVSAYLTVVFLGLANLLQSYLWLSETKGIDLDAVQIGAETKEAMDGENVEKNRKMPEELLDETKKKFIGNDE